MSRVLADGMTVAPAAFAFGGGGFGRHRGVGRAGFEFEFAQDEKLFEFGKASRPRLALLGIGEVQDDGGFEVVGDDLFGACFFEGL